MFSSVSFIFDYLVQNIFKSLTVEGLDYRNDYRLKFLTGYKVERIYDSYSWIEVTRFSGASNSKNTIHSYIEGL